MQDLNFDNAATLISLLKRAMRCVGTWPEKNFINEVVLTVTVTYLSLHCTLMFIDLGRNITDITLVVSCGMEGGFIFLALLKIIICRINRKTLAIFIEDIRGDFVTENYQTTEEKMAFLSYNNFSRKFTKVSLVSAFAASGSYFFMTLASNIEMVVTNSSYGFQLPYRVLNLIEPTNTYSFNKIIRVLRRRLQYDNIDTTVRKHLPVLSCGLRRTRKFVVG
ncbi:hypothetical protein KPH14_002612 [Odynerus spinipes]|uniref:Uncharacterized protein n=1 Tax=Odynerus spinipes TaxID=1348599 RepID=A0AAD9VHM4_9HYME|nr:hypothetical protein KPH14_002612 [Odynerus spinipes]